MSSELSTTEYKQTEGILTAERKQQMRMALFEGLKVHEIKFVEAYFENGGNALRAYKSARPEVKESSAGTEGSRLLNNPVIQRAIKDYTALTINETFVLRGVQGVAISAEKDSDRLKAYSKLGEFLGMGNNKNQNAHKQGGSAIQINIGVPSDTKQLDANIIDV